MTRDRSPLRLPRRLWRDVTIYAVLVMTTVAVAGVAYDFSRRLEATMLERLAQTHVDHWAAALDRRLGLSSGAGAAIAPAAANGAVLGGALGQDGLTGGLAGNLKAFRFVDSDGLVALSSDSREVSQPALASPTFARLSAVDGDEALLVDSAGADAVLAHARLPIMAGGQTIGAIELTVDLADDAAAVMGQFNAARAYGVVGLLLLLLVCGAVVSHFAAGRLQARRGYDGLQRAAAGDRTARAEMLAFMSHQMRTPLNTMIGFAELIRDEAFGPLGKSQYKDYAAGIHESGLRLMDTMADVIDLSHPHGNNWQLVEEEIDVIYLANQALEAVRRAADARDIRLSLVTRNPVTRLRGDRRMTVRMIAALMSHAVDQSADGGQCRLTLTSEADGSAVFQASDTAVSEEESRRGLSFALSGRLESNLAGSGRSGAGLALARILAERHGAVVELSNRIGGGTCIRIRFPAARSLDVKPLRPRRSLNPIHTRLAARLAAAT